MSDPLQALKAVSGEVVDPASTNLPPIPAVPATSDQGIANFLTSVKLWLEKAAGSATGFATKQEMVQAGVLASDENGNIVPVTPASSLIPPAPTGLTATGAVETIIVSWDDPRAAYGNHAYAEVWAKGDASFTGAVMVGQSASYIFAHVTGDTAQRWYWVRFVSTSGVKGPFSSVDGIPGSTSIDPAELFAAIEASELAANPFFTITAAEVTAGTNVINGVALPAGTYIKDAFIAAATISNAMIRNAAIDTAKIADLSVVTAKIANAAIDTAKIADASILTAKIANAQITGAKIDTATITTANIADASITNAKIGDAEIDTLHVQGNSITVSAGGAATTSTPSSGVEYTLQEFTLNFALAAPQAVLAIYDLSIHNHSIGSWGYNYTVKLYRGATLLKTDVFQTEDAAVLRSGAQVYVESPGVGSHTYKITMTPAIGYGGLYVDSGFFLSGAMR